MQTVINNTQDSELKLKSIIQILVMNFNENNDSSAIENELHKLIIWEGAKTYYTRHVNQNIEYLLFKPHKDLCTKISLVIN